MKTSILTLFILLSSVALNAQDRPSPEKLATEKVKSLDRVLSFTPQQSEKVMKICVDQFKSRDSLLTVIRKRTQDQQARNTAITSTFNKLELDTDKKINSVLNSEQKIAYGKYVSSRQPGRAVSVQAPTPRN